jgi:hypothetical protein
MVMIKKVETKQDGSYIERNYDEQGKWYWTNEYNKEGLLICNENSNGSFSKRTYDEYNNIVFDEGIGNRSLQPYWYKWERTYLEDGSQEVYITNSEGWWEKYRFDEDYTYDFENSNDIKYDKKPRFKPSVSL